MHRVLPTLTVWRNESYDMREKLDQSNVTLLGRTAKDPTEIYTLMPLQQTWEEVKRMRAKVILLVACLGAQTFKD